MNADLILTNARVLTMVDACPFAEAVALRDGRILAVGTRAEVTALAGPQTQIIDCGGKTLLPGFIESHLHLVLGGAALTHLQLAGVRGAPAIGKAFAEFAATHPHDNLLLAQGFSYQAFDHPTTRHDLDAIIADRPIACMARDLHTVWANTIALEQAGLLHGAKMPHGHEVVLGADGLASGELKEFEAFSAVIALGGEARLNLGIATGEEPDPWPTEAERAIDRGKIKLGLAHLARHGITSAVNMDGNRYTLALLREMQQAGELTARLKVPFHMKPHMDVTALDRAVAMTREFDDAWLSCGFVKLFMDGVIDSLTAFMVNDYLGHPGHRAEPLFSADQFNEIAIRADALGLQVAVHAIGDGAVQRVIDGYAAARQANGTRDARHRIEHIELIDTGDIPRLGELGIVASLQPPHVPGAMDFAAEPTLSIIGQDRIKDAYLCKTLVDQGARVAFASDWPVTDVSVLRGIGSALTRQVFDAPGCIDERLSLMQVLRAYTADGAYAAHLDHLTGSLQVGLAGDLVLLNGDIEATPVAAIGDMEVALTVVGGRVSYDATAR